MTVLAPICRIANPDRGICDPVCHCTILCGLTGDTIPVAQRVQDDGGWHPLDNEELDAWCDSLGLSSNDR